MRYKPSPSDILCAILLETENDYRQRTKSSDPHQLQPKTLWRANGADFQKIFNQLRNDHPDILDVFIFSSSGPRPFSPTLAGSLEALRLVGFLRHPDIQAPELFIITNAARNFLYKELRLTKKEWDLVGGVAGQMANWDAATQLFKVV